MSGLQLIEIIPAAFVGMLLGAFWYSSLAFGNAWLAATGQTKEMLGDSKGPMIGSVLACILMAAGVSVLFELIGVGSLAMALCIGALLGGLIIFPAMLSDSLFNGTGFALLFIQCGYRFLKVVLMSLVVYLI